ncbi:putative mediator of RNA polymerase II transcription subunit 12 [Aplysia californica]|uniref:Mediator of RNA polymerase II transcription subunit 12 n=1 Tax=Aplysia californica TaxID=6500 RepID=A0ABM1A030_APLCA|nr:putative mediator of RNA polymerase II transcription subunit 12 [Aplysia californica]
MQCLLIIFLGGILLVNTHPIDANGRSRRALIINTEGRPLITNGQSAFLGNLQGHDPVAAEQQMGSPNFQQPNMLTGQQVQIQSATSRPVFGQGMFGQQQVLECTPTTRPVQGSLFQQQQQGYGQQYSNQFQQQQQIGNSQQQQQQQQHYNGQGPLNPMQQITGTSQPFQIFQQPDHVPLSMQMSSQQNQPIFVNNQNHHQQHQTSHGASLQNGQYLPLGQQQPSQINSGSSGLTNQQQQQQQQQLYQPRVTSQPTRNPHPPSGYQPINVGKRSIRRKILQRSLFSDIQQGLNSKHKFRKNKEIY